MTWIPWQNRSTENKKRRNALSRQTDSYKEAQSKWRVENVEQLREYGRNYRKDYFGNNRAKCYAHRDSYARGLVIAKITGLFWPQIEEFYKEARRLTEETGVLHVVDHYWPINGKGSCGLHVPWNLRVITGSENDSKGNKEPEDHWSSVLLKE